MKKLSVVLCLAIVLCLTSSLSNIEETRATKIPYPATIGALCQSSDLVAKIKVLSIDPGTVENSSLKTDFWKVRRAHFQLVSAVKGTLDAPQSLLIFRSSEPYSKTPPMLIDVGPENYPHFNLQPGHCYIVFMKLSSASGALEQTASRFGLRSWEGFVQCTDDQPIQFGTSAHQAVWNELTKTLRGKDRLQQKEAALTLLNLSCSPGNGTIGSADFDRARVVEVILSTAGGAPAGCDDDTSLKQLIEAIGSASPYSSDSTRMRYLWSKAANPLSFWSEWNCTNQIINTPASAFLSKIADGKHQPSVCAAAILSMGGCHNLTETQPALPSRLSNWLKSPVAEIRAAAAILGADYADSAMTVQITNMLKDEAPAVRRAAAYSVGISHPHQAIAQLGKLLHDPDQKVRASAALSLMTYPVDNVRSVLTENLGIPEFSSAFLARLASADSASVRDKLLLECQQYNPLTQPGDLSLQNLPFLNGLATSPQRLCVQALTSYLDNLSGKELQKPDYKDFLDSIEKIGAVDPSQTGRVYEILICHRLTERAAAFKKMAQAAQPSIPGIAFEQPERELQAGSLKYK